MESLIFLLVALIAFSYSGYRIYQLIVLMRAHQAKVFRFDNLPLRFQAVLLNVFGQAAVLQSRFIGVIHAMIFWGFLIITIGTLEQFASTLIPGFTFEFIGATLYAVLVFLQDVFTLLVLVGVILAAYRRYIIKPKHLGQSVDANIVLVLTGCLMIAIFGMNAFLIVAQHPDFASSMPFSSMLSAIIEHFHLSSHQAMQISHVFKWLHMLIVLGFGMYIPSSKHLHVLAAGPNTFFKHLKYEKPMRPIDFEKATQLGAGKVTDLSWKDALDYYACTECGRCQEVCPAYNTQKPLSPKKLILDLKHNLYAQKEAILGKNTNQIGPLLDTQITEDVIWACTSCRACEIACPVFIEHTDKIYEVRRHLVMTESKFPAELQPVFRNLETNATPWAFSSADRANWAQDLNIPTIQENTQAEFLLWVGCAGSFDDRNKKVLRAFVNILKAANVSFAILGNEEQCTGDPARRIGNEFLFQTLANANIEVLNRYQVKKIVTACPHCFNTLKNEYPQFGGTYEVIHHSAFIHQLVQSKKIIPQKTMQQTITFHDSCYLGRWNQLYTAPRDVIHSVSQNPIREMESHHERSLCCGAGGGRMFMEENIGTRINIARTQQAIRTNASVIASSCPFCLTMLTDGVKSQEQQNNIQVLDIAELIDRDLQTSHLPQSSTHS